MLVWEPSGTSDFSKLPSDTTQQNQDSLFYARSQLSDCVPPCRPIFSQNCQKWRDVQRELERGPQRILICFTCYIRGQHLTSDIKLTECVVAQAIVNIENLTSTEKIRDLYESYLQTVDLASFESNRNQQKKLAALPVRTLAASFIKDALERVPSQEEKST